MRSQVIKFRVSKRTKTAAMAAAERSRTTVSALMRSLLLQAASGRVASDAIRADMVVIRQLANQLLEETDGSVMAETGRRLREVAARHLGPVS